MTSLTDWCYDNLNYLYETILATWSEQSDVPIYCFLCCVFLLELHCHQVIFFQHIFLEVNSSFVCLSSL